MSARCQWVTWKTNFWGAISPNIPEALPSLHQSKNRMAKSLSGTHSKHLKKTLRSLRLRQKFEKWLGWMVFEVQKINDPLRKSSIFSASAGILATCFAIY
jgi:hypothetical protein